MSDRKGPRPAAPKKQPYRTPRLTTHGDLRTLTRSPKAGTGADGGGAPKTKQTGNA
jgi:hypothetical protein